jgi:hypothetical protein
MTTPVIPCKIPESLDEIEHVFYDLYEKHYTFSIHGGEFFFTDQCGNRTKKLDSILNIFGLNTNPERVGLWSVVEENGKHFLRIFKVLSLDRGMPFANGRLANITANDLGVLKLSMNYTDSATKWHNLTFTEYASKEIQLERRWDTQMPPITPASTLARICRLVTHDA